MLSLTYVSSARTLLDAPQLRALLADIRPKNQALGLTGMLLYSGGNIIQVLEGPDEVVELTFTTIAADSRHRGLMVLLRDPITARAFPDWSMGFRHLDPEEVEQTPGLTSFLQRPAGADLGPATNATHRLLELFRSNMR